MNTQFSSPSVSLPKRGLRTILAVVLLAAVMVFGVLSFAPSAHAATTAAPATNHLIFFYPNGGSQEHSCATGNHGTINPPLSAENQCISRVWLYQNPQKTGRALCISPGSSTGTLHTRWVFFVIVSNQNRCS